MQGRRRSAQRARSQPATETNPAPEGCAPRSSRSAAKARPRQRWRPLRDLNPRYWRERPGSWAGLDEGDECRVRHRERIVGSAPVGKTSSPIGDTDLTGAARSPAWLDGVQGRRRDSKRWRPAALRRSRAHQPRPKGVNPRYWRERPGSWAGLDEGDECRVRHRERIVGSAPVGKTSSPIGSLPVRVAPRGARRLTSAPRGMSCLLYTSPSPRD